MEGFFLVSGFGFFRPTCLLTSYGILEIMTLNIFTGREYLLSHEQLARQSNSIVNALDNPTAFRSDFDKGQLNVYRQSFVAYQQGVLCGQSKNAELLFNKAREYYGGSNLAVFLVPDSRDDLEQIIDHKLGQ